MTLRNSLVWFRRDLRVDDHAALRLDTDILAGLPSDDRRVGFLLDSVRELDARLRAMGGYLIVRHGRAAQVIPALAAELDAESVFANRNYERQAIARRGAIIRAVVDHEAAREKTLARFQAIRAPVRRSRESGNPYRVDVTAARCSAWIPAFAGVIPGNVRNDGYRATP